MAGTARAQIRTKIRSSDGAKAIITSYRNG